MRAVTYQSRKHNRPTLRLDTESSMRVGLRICSHRTLPPAFLISHQSVPKNRLATAMNQGMIAPGNHWIMDSLRGAPPREKPFGARSTLALYIAGLFLVDIFFDPHYNNPRSQSRSPLRGAGCIRLRGRLVTPTREPDTDHAVVGKDADLIPLSHCTRRTGQQCDTFFRKGRLLC